MTFYEPALFVESKTFSATSLVQFTNKWLLWLNINFIESESVVWFTQNKLNWNGKVATFFIKMCTEILFCWVNYYFNYFLPQRMFFSEQEMNENLVTSSRKLKAKLQSEKSALHFLWHPQ